VPFVLFGPLLLYVKTRSQLIRAFSPTAGRWRNDAQSSTSAVNFQRFDKMAERRAERSILAKI